MTTEEKRKKLFDFVVKAHGSQKRKYTGMEYWTHCLAVARLSEMYVPDSWEPAILHDVLEDTEHDVDSVKRALIDCGYTEHRAIIICVTVRELTDEFTHEKYPEMNRAVRKTAEADRLGGFGYTTQSIKCADLIDNTMSIAVHDPGFAKVYLREKRYLLNTMRKANIDLYIKACFTYQKAVNFLEDNSTTLCS